jgi:hypothetical protein
MMQITRRQAHRTLLLLSVFLTGCGGPHAASVTGTVVYDGQPLTTGAVVFQPVHDGPIAIGDIQSDGSYTLSVGDAAGVDPGDYRVTVAASEPMPEATPENPQPLPKSLIPARYSNADQSGLTFKVEPGSNRFDIKLEK